MRIAAAADHAGFLLKQALVAWLEQQGHEVQDLGPESGAASVDYPDFAERVARALLAGRCARGLLCCGTGVGMAMTANRFPGVRAVAATDLFTTRMARAHNDANVLCLGGRVLGDGLAIALLEVFLTTDWDAGRHAPRVAKIDAAAHTTASRTGAGTR